jgi:ribosomal protein L14
MEADESKQPLSEPSSGLIHDQMRTVLDVADNSGARRYSASKSGWQRRKYAIGNIVVSVGKRFPIPR